jgi:tRNA(fMet)-specific endonuclease VapC
MFVLDANTSIYFFRGMRNVSVKLLRTPPKDIGIPSFVLFELEVGIAKSTSPAKRSEQLAEFASVATVLPFGLEEARIAAHYGLN